MKCIVVSVLFLFCGMIVLIAPQTLESQEVMSVNARFGIAFPLNSIGISIQSIQLAPIIELFGIGMNVQLTDILVLAPFLDLGVSEVLYSSQTQLVHPRSLVDINETNYSTLLSFYLGIPLLLKFKVGDSVNIGFGISPTLVFRVPINGKDRARVGQYYINEGRFFVPEAIIDFGYRFQEVELLLSLRGLIPISNLWDGDDSPFINDFAFSFTTQLRFILPKSPESRVGNSSLSASR